jgi:hypothetical protein
MYEKDEQDFSIEYDIKRNNFSLYVGTWHNSSQSFADCIFYLSLCNGTDKDLFLKRLEEFNYLFINNKDKIVQDIEQNGLNLLNSVLNEHEINEITGEYEYEDIKNELLKENEFYIFEFQKADYLLEETYKTEIVFLINESKSIIEVYEKLQEVKQRMKQEFYDDFYEYLTIETD